MTSQLSQQAFERFLFPSHKYLPTQSLALKALFSFSVALVSAKGALVIYCNTSALYSHMYEGNSLYAFYKWGHLDLRVPFRKC